MAEQDPRLAALARLLSIVDQLRAPEGCPWDRKQTLASMAPHVLEEAYELSDELRCGKDSDVLGECGDLLMNLFLITRIAEDEQRFSMTETGHAICDKLIRRHPHVFGDGEAKDADEALENWERIKREERDPLPAGSDKSIFSGLRRELPALLSAQRVGEKAAAVGFDWPDREGPIAKIREELEELLSAIDAAPAEREEATPAELCELGDLLFAVVNLSRKLGISAEMALRGSIDRFKTRFSHVQLALGDRLEGAGLDEMEALWEEAKGLEQRSSPTEAQGSN